MPATQTSKPQLYVPGTKMLDSRFRELPPEVGALGFTRLAVRKINEEDRTFTCVVSTGEVDRYGEIVDPKAFDRATIAEFLLNPVLLAGHRHIGSNGEPTIIGHWLSIAREGNEVIATGKMSRTPLAELYWQLMKDGSLRAFSIGFMVREWEMREIGEGETRYSVRAFTKIELVEISAVAVPANRGALLKAAGFGDITTLGAEPIGDAVIEKLAAKLAEKLDFKGAVQAAFKQHINGDPDGPMARLFIEVLEAAGCAGQVRDYFDEDLDNPAAGTKRGAKPTDGTAAFFHTQPKD